MLLPRSAADLAPFDVRGFDSVTRTPPPGGRGREAQQDRRRSTGCRTAAPRFPPARRLSPRPGWRRINPMLRGSFDIQALERARSGDEGALRFLYMRHEADVRRHLAGVLGDEDLAEDMTQAMFAQL